MGERLQRAVGAGMPATAILAAVDRYAPGGPGDVLQTGGSEAASTRHVWALAHVLRLLAADLAAGDPPPARAGQPAWLDLDADVCVSCEEPGGTPRSELPLKSVVCDKCMDAAVQAA